MIYSWPENYEIDEALRNCEKAIYGGRERERERLYLKQVASQMISRSFPPMKSPLQKRHHDISVDPHLEYPAIHENPFLQTTVK